MSWIKENGSLIRRAALIVTIISAILFIAILWIGVSQFAPLWVTAAMFTGLFLLVLVGEITGVLTGIRKTVSTRYRYWAIDNPVLSFFAMLFFLISMIALTIHLGVFW